MPIFLRILLIRMDCSTLHGEFPFSRMSVLIVFLQLIGLAVITVSYNVLCQITEQQSEQHYVALYSPN